MADKKIYTMASYTPDEFYEAKQKGYDALNREVPDAEFVSTYEYLATTANGGEVWRAYAHKGMDMWIAEVVDYE